MKICVVGANKDFVLGIRKAIKDSGYRSTYSIVVDKITPKELSDKAGDCEILVASPSGFGSITKEHLNSMPKLRFISMTSVGVDWLNTQAASQLGITVSNQKGVNAESVAQHCFGMIIDLTKRISEADRNIRDKGEFRPAPYMGIELYGKTLGIIGTGDIGQRVARIAKGFSMNVIGVNKSRRKLNGIKIVSLEKLLKASDIIVVTLPLSPRTKNMISTKEIKLMRRGIVLVSISREAIINKEAIVKAIGSGHVRGFGFDADIMKVIKKGDPYLRYPNILITPHTASMTEEADKGYSKYTVENINAFLEGKPIRLVE